MRLAVAAVTLARGAQAREGRARGLSRGFAACVCVRAGVNRRPLPKLGKARGSPGDIAESAGVRAAKAAAAARKGPPAEADAPPPSTFPMTPAAREALRLWRETHKP